MEAKTGIFFRCEGYIGDIVKISMLVYKKWKFHFWSLKFHFKSLDFDLSVLILQGTEIKLHDLKVKVQANGF